MISTKAWIARDMLGDLHIFYIKKPWPLLHQWINHRDANNLIDIDQTGEYCNRITEKDLPEGINPQWSDNEPIEIELTIK